MSYFSYQIGVSIPFVTGAIELGSGRLVPTLAALAGLVSVVVGGLALARSVRLIGFGYGRVAAAVALVAGPLSLVVGGLHAANSAGGFGAGNGLAGALAALALGFVGTSLGGFSLIRLRRPGSAD